LGIGDWAQSPIPNPQSPISEKFVKSFILILKIILNLFKKDYYEFNNTNKKIKLIIIN
jgi:hypothetical protein